MNMLSAESYDGSISSSMDNKLILDTDQTALTVYEDTPVFEIASIFAEKNINRVALLDQNGHLMGIVARADIFRTTCAL
jgi:CBS-domain-containing membrane protein